METAALALLIGLAVILTAHYLQGGSGQVGRYLNFILTGRGKDGQTIAGSSSQDSSGSGSGGGGGGGFYDFFENLPDRLPQPAPPPGAAPRPNRQGQRQGAGQGQRQPARAERPAYNTIHPMIAT